MTTHRFLKCVFATAMFSQSALAFSPSMTLDVPAKRASCGCKNKGDCTCAKDKCKCKSCQHHVKANPLVIPLRGNAETTRLPDMAHLDARGGIFI